MIITVIIFWRGKDEFCWKKKTKDTRKKGITTIVNATYMQIVSVEDKDKEKLQKLEGEQTNYNLRPTYKLQIISLNALCSEWVLASVNVWITCTPKEDALSLSILL